MSFSEAVQLPGQSCKNRAGVFEVVEIAHILYVDGTILPRQSGNKNGAPLAVT